MNPTVPTVPTTPTGATGGIRHGAALAPPVIAYALLTVLAAVVPSLAAGVSPWTSDAALYSFVHDHHGAVRAQALLTIAAAVPLAVLSAVFSDRIRHLGLEVPGRLIALVGGGVAAAVLAASGMTTLALLAVHGRGGQPVLQFGQALSTALGGTAFAAFAGLLVAGVSVTGLLGRLLPRGLAWFGLVMAVVGQLALLTTVTAAANPLLPVARFGTVVFLLGAAFGLRRRDRPSVG